MNKLSGMGNSFMAKIIKFISIVVFSLVLLSSCKQREWPTFDYSNFVDSWLFPPTPSCIQQHTFEAFAYRDEFNACKQDVMNYKLALDTFFNNSTNKVRNLLESVNQEVLEVKMCFDEHFNYHDYQPKQCPSAKVTRELEEYSISSKGLNLITSDTINFWAGIPYCAREVDSAPRNKFDYKISCKDDLINFLNPNSNNSAQAQYDRYVKWLSAEISARKEMVVSQFNCKAEGEYVCSMPMF